MRVALTQVKHRVGAARPTAPASPASTLYEDKTSLAIEDVSPDEAITPARVREIHREQLAKLEAERGDRFWVYDGDVSARASA
jgi:hypothetical protein